MPLFSLDEDLADATAVEHIRSADAGYASPFRAKDRRRGRRQAREPYADGAFKCRGYRLSGRLRRADRLPKGLVTATRGNHGQSVAVAAARNGLPAVIVVPKGNSVENNAAMKRSEAS